MLPNAAIIEKSVMISNHDHQFSRNNIKNIYEEYSKGSNSVLEEVFKQIQALDVILP